MTDSEGPVSDTLASAGAIAAAAAAPAATSGQHASELQILQEQSVGISAYASEATGSHGLRCVFKQRYTDFQVNEILANGQVLHLTDIAEPPAKKQKKEKVENTHERSGAEEVAENNGQQAGLKRSLPREDDSPSKKQKLGSEAEPATQSTAAEPPVLSKVEIPDSDKTILTSLFGDTVTADIIKLYGAVLAHPNRKPRDHATVKSDIIESKPTRTQAHTAVRTIFSSKLETATLQEEPGRMTIRAAALRPQVSQDGPKSKKDNSFKGQALWEELGGEYLHFTLYKENKDTMEALYFMASELKIKVAAFSFAGTKDRRGVTVQRVAAFRVQKERLMHLTKSARGWKIGGFEYKPHGLALGELQGNEFVITLRDCQLPGTEELQPQERLAKIDAVVQQAARNLGKNGYINFYGLQRFGSFSTGTHVVGTRILQNDLKGAVDSILAYDQALLPANLDDAARSKLPKDDIDRAEAIRIWREEKNASKARQLLPRRFQAENNIIQFLGSKRAGHKQDQDWQGALSTIQRGLRLMYVHAYQSLVWNNAAVRRRQLYGDQVVDGDLVIIGEKDDGLQAAVDKTDQDGEVVVHPEQESSGEDGFVRARRLSKEEAESGRWDIFDIVLPLPGWDILYPSNELGKFYEEFMGSEEGGQLDPHNMRRLWKDASLSGSYRKMMSRPLHGVVEVQTFLYSGDQQLADTDADKLQCEEKQPESTSNDHDEQENVSQVAIVLKMQLGSSQYATMALRELTKGGAVAYKPEFSTDRQRS